MVKGVLDGQNPAPRVAVEDELFEPEAATHLLHFRGEASKSPKRGIVGLVGVVAAELIVVVRNYPVLQPSRLT